MSDEKKILSEVNQKIFEKVTEATEANRVYKRAFLEAFRKDPYNALYRFPLLVYHDKYAQFWGRVMSLGWENNANHLEALKIAKREVDAALFDALYTSSPPYDSALMVAQEVGGPLSTGQQNDKESKDKYRLLLEAELWQAAKAFADEAYRIVSEARNKGVK